MATEYHLLTCLGRGVTATLTVASPCVVTYAASGMRPGHPVVWETNSDTLPTGLAHGTTYYVRPIDANTFHLYDTESHAKDTGSTTGRVDTSGSQSGTHKLVGDYWYRLPASDPGGGGNYRGRYLYGGSYQVFGTWNTWHTGRSLRANYSTELTLEIEGKWTCLSGGWIAVAQIAGFFSCTITTKLRGVWGSGYHGGVPGAGWVQACGAYNRINGAKIVEGIEIDSVAYADSPIVPSSTPTIRFCIVSLHPSYRIVNNISAGATIIGNIIIGGSTGILISNYSSSLGSVIANNLIVGAGTGFNILTSADGVFIANNAAIGCTVANWGATPPASSYLGHNAGVSGDTPWAISGEPSVTTLTTAHFADYANGDYRPTSDSPLIDAGSQVFSSLLPVAITNALDAANGDPRPSYKGGVATDWDIGPFEYDHGYGLAPANVAFDITGMIEGSVLAIYRTSDHAEIVAPTVIGASGAYSTTYSWTGNVPITVVVRKATGGTKYLPYSAPGLITAGGFGLVVSQVEDLVLNG